MEHLMLRNALIMILLVSSSVQVSGQDDRLKVTYDPLDKSTLICDIKYAKFKVPKNWRPNRGTGKTYAILTIQGEAYPNVSQMIMFDVGKPSEADAKSTAEAFAKLWKGKLHKETVRIDKEEGFRVNIPPTQKETQPVDCVIVFHRERAFMIMAGGKTDEGLSKTLDEVIASWVWKP
jgi:hypothetical protein